MRIKLIVLLLMIHQNSIAQINELFGIAKDAKTAYDKKQKTKLAEEYLQYFEMNGKKIPFLRVPNDKIKGDAKNDIIAVQDNLEKSKKLCLAGELSKVHLYSIPRKIQDITILDKDWIVSHYAQEAAFYEEQDNIVRKELERKRRLDQAREDSTRRVADNLARKKMDSIRTLEEIAKKRKQDSLAYYERIKGWHFVNAKSIKLYSSASEKSKVIGDIGTASYVKILGAVDTKGFVKVSISDYEGYVYKKYLVDDLDKITVSNAEADVNYAKKNYTTAITAKATAQDKQQVQQAKQVNRVGSGIYYRGKRGGCYYYSPSGKKVYVDRSLCN